MLKFEPFSIELLKKALPFIRHNTSLCSDHASGALFMWHSPDTRFCFWDDTFVIHQTVGGQPAFSWPTGKNPHAMIDKILSYAKINRLPLRFYAIDESTLKVLMADERLKPITMSYDRRWSDYVYSFEDALTFKGRKFSGQRNHINKFKKLYGEPIIRFLTPEDNPALDALISEYEAEHEARNKLEKLELEHTKRLLGSYAELNLPAVCLIVDDKIAAFSIGEIVGDMLTIHVEKALTKYQGIYPTMYNGFVNLIAKHYTNLPKLVNRQDDSGDEGLRTSKMQYRPVFMVNKYLVHINSPASKLEKIPVIDAGDIVITEIREEDKKAYMHLNTDIENNRFWGYDYREDSGITSQIDENTFYDFAMYDMKVGDSINFAIRPSENGEMIGECILWNFASDGSAELGCRLNPAYHKKGYGKSAFGAVADFAVKNLGLKVWARCYRENEASQRMIISNGFIRTRCDDTFYYFEK